MSLRIHLTNGKESKVVKVLHGDPPSKYEEIAYQIAYCGHTYESFSGPFDHSVYLISALEKLMELHKEQLCPQCIASEELGFDILGAK